MISLIITSLSCEQECNYLNGDCVKGVKTRQDKMYISVNKDAYLNNSYVSTYMIIVHLLRSHVDRVVFLPVSHIKFLVKSKVEDYKKTQLTMNNNKI